MDARLLLELKSLCFALLELVGEHIQTLVYEAAVEGGLQAHLGVVGVEVEQLVPAGARHQHALWTHRRQVQSDCNVLYVFNIKYEKK